MSEARWTEVKCESKNYFIHASWEQRAETPDELCARFLRMIDLLEQIDPVLSLWNCGLSRPEKLEEVRDRYVREIAAGVTRDDWRRPMPEDGYRFGALTRDAPKSRSFVVNCKGGSVVGYAFTNDVLLSTLAEVSSRPDADVVACRVFRAALLAIVEAWDPVKAGAYSHELVRLDERSTHFQFAWIQYLCPWLAQKITPPPSVLAERLPNGGLLMTATTETFNVNNPAHLSAARDMAAAMAPLDELPWPSRR